MDDRYLGMLASLPRDGAWYAVPGCGSDDPDNFVGLWHVLNDLDGVDAVTRYFRDQEPELLITVSPEAQLTGVRLGGE